MKELDKLCQLYESGNVTLMLQLIKGLGYDEIEVFKELIDKYKYTFYNNMFPSNFGFAFYYPELKYIDLNEITPEDEMRMKGNSFTVWFNNEKYHYNNIESVIEFIIKCFNNE